MTSTTAATTTTNSDDALQTAMTNPPLSNTNNVSKEAEPKNGDASAAASSSKTDNADEEEEEEEDVGETTVLLTKVVDPTKSTSKVPWWSKLEPDDDFYNNDEVEEDGAGNALDRALDQRREAVRAACVALCCLCLFIAIIVTGAWLAAAGAPGYSATSSQTAGYILLTVGAVVGFCLCCACCTNACSESFSLDGGLLGEEDEVDPHDPHQRPTHASYVFHRYNDAFKHDREQHESLLRETTKPLPKKALELLKRREKERLKALKERKAKQDAAVVERIRDAVEGKGEASTDPAVVLRELRRKVYVIDYDAESASPDRQVDSLTEQVTLVLRVANPATDQVVIRLSSPGGAVTTYGLAANQLQRIRNKGLRLTVCIDEIGASGGFMMACVADWIVAAPFSFVGSIGVVVYVPNFQRLTRDKLAVDVHQFTAGKYKRTVDVFGEVTEEGKRKLNEELERVHEAFARHVLAGRGARIKKPLEEITTGEGWLATEALELGLVDEVKSSDEWLEENFLSKNIDVFILRRRVSVRRRGMFRDMLGIWSSGGGGGAEIFAPLARLARSLLNNVAPAPVSSSPEVERTGLPVFMA